MKCWLTENARLYVVLRELSSGYETGDIKSFFPFLADDCVLESQWVLMPNEGKDSVIKYLKGKGKTLKRTKSFPKCCVYEIIGDITTVTNATVTTDFRSYEKASLSLMHTPGKLCLMLTQKLENETVNMVIDVTLGDDGLVRRIDLCNPDFYRCRPFETYVRLNPGDEVVDEDDDSSKHHDERLAQSIRPITAQLEPAHRIERGKKRHLHEKEPKEEDQGMALLEQRTHA